MPDRYRPVASGRTDIGAGQCSVWIGGARGCGAYGFGCAHHRARQPLAVTGCSRGAFAVRRPSE